MVNLLSFVIPCYRSEKTISKVMDEIIDTVSQREGYDYEIVAINDCSPDNLYDVLCRLSKDNPKIKVINFARNMGKHSAVMAGYAVTKGEIVVNLDDDFQCPVYNLWAMIDQLENSDSDVVTAQYKQKKESAFKRVGSNLNLAMTHILLDKPGNLRLENFSVMKAFVCKEIIKYKNPYPYLEGLIFRTTRNVSSIQMEQRSRADEGSSGFTLKKSVALFVNGFTAFSVKPLRISSISGAIFALIGFIYGCYVVVHKLITPNVSIGYSSIMAILLFSIGLMMLMMGLIGEYVGRIYICLNASPQYIIRNTINLDKADVNNENS